MQMLRNRATGSRGTLASSRRERRPRSQPASIAGQCPGPPAIGDSVIGPTSGGIMRNLLPESAFAPV